MLTVAERIKQFNSNRIPVYTALKYALMAENPFIFFRGTCHLFYEDLHRWGNIPVSPPAWICGDLHLENFGSYKGDNRLVYFDLTDFDEGILAPVAWELARIVTSIFIALDAPGSSQKEISLIASLFLQSYCTTLSKGKARYIEQQTATGIVRAFLDKVCNRKQKELIEKRTILRKGKRFLKVDDTKLFALDEKLKKKLAVHLTGWIKSNKSLHQAYEIVDSGFRIAGTGSIGINRYLFLLKKVGDEKYLLIDMKQARPSSLQPYAMLSQPAWASDAARITAIQERMQNMPPALLDVTVFENQSYVLKEMQPTEDKIQFALLKNDYKDIGSVIIDMALLTASTHLRSSGRQGSATADELIAFGENKKWQEKILNYAKGYAVQVKKDHRDYVKAFHAGFFSKH